MLLYLVARSVYLGPVPFLIVFVVFALTFDSIMRARSKDLLCHIAPRHEKTKTW
jgi:hypothetical protein